MTAKSQKHWTGDPAQLLRVGEGFRLADVDPESTPGFTGGKKQGAEDLESGVEELDELQERLFAESRSGQTDARVLLVLQAMDSAGKGGIIRHVVGSVDPQGISLAAFKKPTKEELAHDFLWRIEKRVPEPGFIGVFDRSHYEDVLIGKVRSNMTWNASIYLGHRARSSTSPGLYFQCLSGRSSRSASRSRCSSGEMCSMTFTTRVPASVNRFSKSLMAP